jgi:Tfp pilus assembly protein PilO
MNFSDLNNLDLKDLTSAPAPVRALILVLLFVAIIVPLTRRKPWPAWS